MEVSRQVLIEAPIAQVFAFLDDPENLAELHNSGYSKVGRIDPLVTESDGRRSFDFQMQAGPRSWTQTVEQVLRQPPHHLVTRSTSWTKYRDNVISTLTTDRSLTVEGEGTRLRLVATFEVVSTTWRSRIAKVMNVLTHRAFESELDHQLHFIAERLEAQQASPPPRDIYRR